jgi:hypothetical protein
MEGTSAIEESSGCMQQSGFVCRFFAPCFVSRETAREQLIGESLDFVDVVTFTPPKHTAACTDHDIVGNFGAAVVLGRPLWLPDAEEVDERTTSQRFALCAYP